MSKFLIFKKESALVAIECGTADSKVEFDSLTEQGFTVCSQVVEAASTEEALYFYKDSPQLYAPDAAGSVAVDSALAALMSLGARVL
ncbi:hypothetical protein ACTSKR_15620 [Chitinibacteraceae bacterium HSL-7]